MPPTFLATDPQLTETTAALAEWRNSRPRSARIPDELWSQATQLAQRHGIAQVAAALKLDYKSLKRRLSTGNAAAEARSVPVSPSFVELDLGLPLAPAVCILVLTDSTGRALRMELPQAASSNLAEIAHRLWQVPPCSR